MLFIREKSALILADVMYSDNFLKRNIPITILNLWDITEAIYWSHWKEIQYDIMSEMSSFF